MKLCKEGIENLSVAIVQLSAEDYVEYKKKLHKIDNYGRVFKTNKGHPISREYYAKKLSDLVDWFHDDMYAAICKIDADRFLGMLDRQFEEWKSEYDRKKRKVG